MLGCTRLVPVAIGVWAWVIAAAVFVFRTDFIGNEDGYVGEGGAVAEYSDDDDDDDDDERPRQNRT